MKYDYQKYEVISNKDFRILYPALHASLNQYYPVGLKSSDNKYINHLGYKSLEQIIVRNIQNPNYLEKQWRKDFLKKISRIIDYDSRDITFGFCPNYGGEIVLEQSDDLRYETKICFYISFIHNYYSIQVVYTDRFVTYQREHLPDITGVGILRLVVSPVEGEYNKLFNLIDDFIQETYEDDIFLPFRFDLTKLKGFETRTAISKDFSTPVSNAFFNKGKLLNGEVDIIGDVDYKINKIKS